MRVLITGAKGQLGSALHARFVRDGHHEVTATDVDSMNLANRDEVVGTITSLQPDVIVHAAAMTAVDACESQQDLAWQINALATRHIVDAAEYVGARVTYVSTDYVFDGNAKRPYVEWDIPNPQSIYGLSKLGGERELRPIDTIARTSWLFGRNGNNMVRTVMRLAKTPGELRFVDDQHGKPTCAEDLADMLYLLSIGRRPGLFHVTNEGATTWFQFARDVLEILGEDANRVRPVSTEELGNAYPSPRPAYSVLDNAALRLSGIPLLRHYRDALEAMIKRITDE